MNLYGNDAGKVRIFNGPLALSEIYYFSPLNIFFVREGIAIEKGDILLKDGDGKTLIFKVKESDLEITIEK